MCKDVKLVVFGRKGGHLFVGKVKAKSDSRNGRVTRLQLDFDARCKKNCINPSQRAAEVTGVGLACFRGIATVVA